MNQTQKLLAFIDLLGFSNMVNENEDKARNVLSDFYNVSFDVIVKNPSVKGHLFSDSLLIYSDNKPDLINCLAEIYQNCLLKNKEYNERDKFFLLPRGAMSLGIINTENRVELPNLEKNFIVSTALVHSAKLESLIKGSRLLVAVKKDKREEIEFNWNRDIRYPLLRNDVFKLLNNYNYDDVLWFTPFEESVENKKRLISLLDVAVDLTKDNAKNENVIDQHLWTLRIGLLSYSKYLAREDDEILDMIIKEFSHDKYWLIWLTLIEMIMISPDSWKFPYSPNISNFIFKCIVKPGWAKVIEEINLKGNKRLKTTFDHFIDDMNVR